MKVKSVKIAKLPSFPDFDTDVPQSKRQEIREYLTWRWGEDNVCGIGTFSRLQPKGALADLSKVFGVPYQDAKKISKIIETVAMSKEEDISWSDLIQEAGGELAEWAERYPELFDNIQKFVGLTRQSSTHAAGKVISNVPLLGNLPLRVKNGEVVTQFDADDIEELGYIKYDILGIRHLDTLMNTDEMVHGKIDLDRFYDMTDEQYADKDVWKDFERGDTLGTFQAETGAMAKVAKELKPKSQYDVCALVAINRPGVIDAGQLQPFLNRHNGLESPPSIHPLVDEILKDTYSIAVYQEQVMRIVQQVAGYTAAEADDIRKMIGKKNYEAMVAEKPVFLRKSMKNSAFVDQCGKQDPFVLANDIWDMIQAAGLYSFNLSHAQAYGLVTCWGAYYKHHHKPEYLTALMQTDPENSPRYVREARKLKYKILPPDINDSGGAFTLTEEGIRYGLASVESVGDKAVEDILANRPFKDLDDYLSKTHGRGGRKKNVITNLIAVGAFDKFGSRERVMHDFAVWYGKEIEIPNFKSQEVVTQLEMKLVGNYITYDPMEKYLRMIDDICLSEPSQIDNKQKDSEFLVGGQITKLKLHTTKKGDPMAFMGITWNDQLFDVVVFPQAYDRYKMFLKTDVPVVAEVVKLDSGCHLKDLVRLDLQ